MIKIRIVIPMAAAAAALLVAPAATRTPPGRAAGGTVLWAWERAEDLRFAGAGVSVAVLAGTIRLSGAVVTAVPRLQPAVVLPAQPVIGVVHLDIDRTQPVIWDSVMRARAAAAALALLANPGFCEVQVDFEVRQSQRPILLDLLADIRAGLPPGTHLSMTALAAWCDTETWIADAPVDEVVPMLFRMGPGGEALKRRLAKGGDFRQPVCRTAVGVATDTPPGHLPGHLSAGRRVWMFDPRAWTASDLVALQDRLSP